MFWVGQWGVQMETAAQHHAGKQVTNERTYPHHVTIPVAAAELDIALSRQIIEFHKSRHIQPRHGRTIFRYEQIYYRWCFPDLDTAHAFHEQFGGSLCETFELAQAAHG